MLQLRALTTNKQEKGQTALIRLSV